MVYSNVNKKAEERKLDFGTIYQMGFGESGRGRKMMPITCQKEDMELISNMMHENMNIGTTKSGKPKLVYSNTSTELYMILSSKGGYTRRGNGVIRVLKTEKDNFEIISRGNGADGDAGRIGTWDVVLLKIKDINKDFVVCVRTSGKGYGTPSDLYIYHGGRMYHCTSDTCHEAYDTLDVEMPFTVDLPKYIDYEGFDLSEWCRI